MKRTDLACDFLPHETDENARINSYAVTVDEALAKKLRREQGVYCTVESPAVREHTTEDFPAVVREIAKAIKMLLPHSVRSVLAVGLGNPNMTADSLGAQTCARLTETIHLKNGAEPRVKISVLTPNVLGVTGVESFDVVAGVVSRVKPDAVLAIDSLASAAVSRLASAFQATDTGITPGSGVSNHRERLCRDTLGVPVLSLGVPLVLYASTIIEDALGRECPECDESVSSLLVTPKDVDLYVRDCAELLSSAIVKAFS
ncbi:MAG: GPR endopeptidase [Clostridiales bacterium]|nr:GPR endopeptidase [Clostridiales bacterium]